MSAQALFLGSIGVLVETSDMQRRAFNAAFEEAGLDWHWEGEEYRQMLKQSGGQGRIARYAEERGDTVDADALHAAKVAHYARMMADEGLTLRPGIRDLMDEAANRAIPIGWVTDTGADQLDAIIENLGGAIHRDEFAFIGAGQHIANRKPAPDIYLAALDDLKVSAGEAVAVEDTGICAKAAVAAGIRTIGYPNENASAEDFDREVTVMTTLTPDLLDQ